LLLRAAARIEAYADSAPHGIPAGALAEWARGEATTMPRLS
jgi:hypothetical protein